ncbi:zinc ribbon domain-containing protein [Clostridium beijerinckii]|uniref:Bacterial Ig-like domain-containing protein n=2 Tax=Clostridium beijerinckii TaxID=1520 RepID=A0AAX0AV20_CLOBE|nr:zinc ribbon domain-containing protein [Clostridium beijerinckii]MBA8934335.1 hypothetical protein [Clostridium beijerinckii]NRT86854.1 hypothetical protein [Clostridium beijerinckii]NRU38523.1 hypothetical protein [Clostridium beijerinckii]NSA98198.1 hypothetical protein [Clostridium beijerinckii]NYC72286.1 hypothetical protein [Clostridium beijerinckii]
MICNNCGTNNPDEAHSCGNCGQNFEVQHMPKIYEHKRRKFLKSLFIILGTIFGGIFFFVFFTALPWILLALGITLSPNPPTPKITHGEFPFHLVYEADGKQYTIDDTIICDYGGKGADEGRGKYIKWEERLSSGNKITSFLFNEDYQYGIKLFDGVIQSQGSTTIICDIGNPEYYLGYKKYKDYSPGRVNISSPIANGIISEDELWNKYKIKIIEEKFSEPKVGNSISAETAYKDVAELVAKGVMVTPQEYSYSPGTKQIVFKWKNDTDKQLTSEQSFYIQKKVDDKWQDVYREKAVSFSREEITITPNTEMLHTYDISKYTNNIPAGNYRVVSPVLVPVKEKTFEAHVLCGEFTIN